MLNSPIDALKPNARNARTHSKKQIRQIADSIATFGFVVPILIDEDGDIIAGHGRYEAAKLLSLKQVPVIVVSGLSKAKRRALALADNKIAENAGWRHIGELLEAGGTVYGDTLNIAIWVKSNAGQGSFYRSQHELVGVFRVGKGPHLNNIELGAPWPFALQCLALCRRQHVPRGQYPISGTGRNRPLSPSK